MDSGQGALDCRRGGEIEKRRVPNVEYRIKAQTSYRARGQQDQFRNPIHIRHLALDIRRSSPHTSRMSWTARNFLFLIIACLGAVVAAGLDWGLPTRDSDRFLFASRRTWSGEELATYGQDRGDATRGADVDRDPLHREGRPIVINPDDASRAEIIRRYRLYSNQPDEMITFMSLQQMKPGEGDFDPRLYQYGGLWIYPVGALLKAASILGWIDLRPDVAFYYDHPEQFGRFYVVARAYTLGWYLALLATCAMIARKFADEDIVAAGAAAIVGVCPAVFALAHEAKPHLPGATLMAIGCLLAMRYVEHGRRRDAIVAGIACGLAAGMVLSAAVIGVVLPVMALLRRDRWGTRLVAVLLGAASYVLAYAATNPYVPINLIRDASAVASNFSNTSVMYRGGPVADSLGSGAKRLLEAASIPAIAIFVASIVAVLSRRRRLGAMGVLLVVPASIALLQFFALAAGKPGEYGRFALFPVVAIAIGCAWIIGLIPHRGLRLSTMIVAPALIGVLATLPYVTAFNLDARRQGTRELAAVEIDTLAAPGRTLSVRAEPAPYAVPPIDWWQWRAVLDPTGETTGDPATADVAVRAVDSLADLPPPPAGYRRLYIDAGQRPSPITWANKPFEILVRE